MVLHGFTKISITIYINIFSATSLLGCRGYGDSHGDSHKYGYGDSDKSPWAYGNSDSMVVLHGYTWFYVVLREFWGFFEWIVISHQRDNMTVVIPGYTWFYENT